MAHWSTKYVGQPYVYGEADCGHLVMKVSREEFGAQIPSDDDLIRVQSNLKLISQLQQTVSNLLCKVNSPCDGDIVLMLCRGRPSHVGVYCDIDGIPFVLHATKSAGQVVLHRIDYLPLAFLSVEGYYRWKA